MTLVPSDDPVSVGETVDRYLVEERIGEGGAAVVYRVRHLDRGTPYALKVIRVASSRLIRRVLQEARLQALVRHPNVVSVVDVVKVGGLPGLVLEYVEGPTLEQLLRGFRPNAAQIDGLARDLMEGVQAAHAQGVVHRDLKPANVVLGRLDGGARAKITDFGIAKDVAGRVGLTRTGVTMGTPAYMPPEQFQSARDVDHRADLFALGAILYELASGRRALRGEDSISIHMSATKADFAPLRDVAPGVPRRWAEAVRQCLQPRPADRPASVAELLRQWTGGEPDLGELAARRPAPWDAATLDAVEREPPRAEAIPEATSPPGRVAAFIAAVTRLVTSEPKPPAPGG